MTFKLKHTYELKLNFIEDNCPTVEMLDVVNLLKLLGISMIH